MDKLLLELDAKDVASIVLKKFGQNAKNAGKDVNSLQKDLRGAADEIPGLSNVMGILSKGPIIGLAAGATAVAIGFGAMVKSTIDTADNMNDMSIKLGISTEKLSVLKLYADQSGTSIEDVADAMAKLGVKLASGDKDLAKLGITAGTTDEAFYQVADRIAGTEDPMIRLKIATDAFGKSGKDMLPMLVQGGDALRTMSEEAPIVTTEMARMADEFNDKLEVLKGDFTKLGLHITEVLMTPLQKTLDIVDQMMVSLAGGSDAATQGFKNWSDEVVKLKKELDDPYLTTYQRITIESKLKEAQQLAKNYALTSLEISVGKEGPGSVAGYRGQSLTPTVPEKTAQELQAEKKANDEKKKARIDAAKKLADDQKKIEDERGAKALAENEKEIAAKARLNKQWELDQEKAEDERSKKALAENEKKIAADKSLRDKFEEEQINKEKEKNDKLISMANTTAAALSGPFSQFGKDLFDSNKSLGSSFEDLFGNIAESFSNMLIQMVAEMAAKAAIFGLFNLITGGGFGAATGGLTKFIGIPGFAGGTDYAPGGIALVGEQGPELVQLPRGSKVRTARETAQSGITQVVNIYNQNLSEKQITDIVVKSQRKIALESNWRRTNV